MSAIQTTVVTILRVLHLCCINIRSPRAPAQSPTVSKSSSPRPNKSAGVSFTPVTVQAYRRLNAMGSRASTTPNKSHFQNRSSTLRFPYGMAGYDATKNLAAAS